jgi:hypothetical protein
MSLKHPEAEGMNTGMDTGMNTGMSTMKAKPGKIKGGTSDIVDDAPMDGAPCDAPYDVHTASEPKYDVKKLTSNALRTVPTADD